MAVNWIEEGDIFESSADLIVIPVCCVPGVMGAGLAKAAKEKWPKLEGLHRAFAQTGSLVPYRVPVTEVDNRQVALFPTKDDWRDPSRLDYIFYGMESLSRHFGASWRHVAIPALGCGLGELPWSEVSTIISGAVMRYADKGTYSIYFPDAHKRR